jgi:hypothetical protein
MGAERSEGLRIHRKKDFLKIQKYIHEGANLKGTVQRKLTGVLSGINRKLMICHCSDGCSFFNLKGLRS